ncbi:hypothetical protein QH494_23990 [Sphingomonas sp. AR_OL41]|jgi:opacity protein-like surface antigen|uniref:hypothetical protein n=1 Tax=Sphingomonas sp. AR_OL41 TaxID=3042729 RepID=UPI0024808A07|nr:hypothetical protein [Sphingomonas sp. AR_OL41]MDH7975258.1 hypothetical protein [Sphingomonas sp. AR_OL41]
MRRTTIAIVTALAATLIAGPANAQAARPSAPTAPAQAAAQPALPFPQALILIRASLTALEQANETGIYATLGALGTQRFQADNPPQKLAMTFAPLRDYNISSVLVLEPKFTQLPQLRPDSSMAMAGFFVSDGYRINFQLAYAAEKGRWRLAAINVGIQSQP